MDSHFSFRTSRIFINFNSRDLWGINSEKCKRIQFKKRKKRVTGDLNIKILEMMKFFLNEIYGYKEVKHSKNNKFGE